MNSEKMCSDERSDKVALLFEECIDIVDLERRSAYLDEACQDCPEIRKEVDKLLRAHEASGSFMMGGTPRHLPGAEQPSESGLEAGSSVGPYRLLGLIGEGSTSTVYLAEQEEPVRRWVALKVVKPGMDTRKVILRFSLERQALALMDHPGIAKLLDAGATSSGHPFFVMELVSGVGITAYCDENQLTIRQRLELFIKICDAVLHAHQRGIIHRDIKPDNIMISDTDGRAVLKIIDFGIAKVLHSWGPEETIRTGVMPFLGTPAYMSPEQVQMTSPDLDTRTDIYSLGALLYELLAGHPPFDHDRLMEAGLEEMCRIIRTVEPVAPSERFSRLPPDEQAEIAAARGTTRAELRRALLGDLDWITLKALEKSREQRYPTADGIARDITRHFEHRPVSAAAPSRRYRMVKMLRRNRKSVIAAGTVTTLVLASTIMVVIMAINARISARQAEEMGEVATYAERESHRAMVAMHVSSGLAAADDRYHDRAVLWFANAAREAGPDDDQYEVNARRTLSWLSKVSMPVGVLKLDTALQVLEFSPDSRYLLAQARDRSWQLWDSATQAVVPWAVDGGLILAAAWSPDGGHLAIVIPDGEIRIHDVNTGTLLQSLKLIPAPVTIGFSPDGRYLVAGDTIVQVFDLEGQAPPRKLLSPPGSFVGLAFAAGSNEVIGVSEDGWARLFEINDSSGPPPVLRDFPHRPAIRMDACSSKSNYRHDFLDAAVLSLPVLSADGNRLLTRTGSYEITFWDPVNGDAVRRIEDVCCSCRFITDPVSNVVACGIQGGKVGIWDVSTGEARQLLPSQGACVLDIAFGRGGESLITAQANGVARLWSVQEGKETQAPLHHCLDVDRVAYTQDGRMVATGQSDGLVRIWNVLEPEPDEHTQSKEDAPTVVRMDHDGLNFVLTREPSWDPCRDACISRVTVYSAESGFPRGPTSIINSCVEAAAFSPDSRLLAVGIGPPGGKEAGRLAFFNLEGVRPKRQEFTLPSGPASLAWSPDADHLAVICRSGELMVVQPEPSPQLRWSAPIVTTRSRINPMIAYTADGLSLVSLGTDGNIQVREALNGALRYPPLVAETEGFWSFTMSGDSRYMATATISGEVAIWDVERGLRIGNALSHPGWVYRCQFSPDQKTLVTASHDGKVRLWDWRKEQLVATAMVHPAEVYDAAFTPNGRWLLTACRDGNIRVWETGSGELAAPPIRVGQQAFNIEITRDGGHAVIGSLGKDVVILSLDVLQDDLPYEVDDLCLMGEVISGCVVQQGSIRDLTTEEWLDRYERIRKAHPNVFSGGQFYGLHQSTVEKAAVVDGFVSLSQSVGD